jgi:hypothetical protein
MTIEDKFSLFRRLDKLNQYDYTMTINKWLGCASVLVRDPKVWAELEKYISEYEQPQVSLFPTPTDSDFQTLEKVMTKKLDKSFRI